MGYVDDTRSAINGFADHNTTMADLCLSAQKDCQLWHNLLGVVNQQVELPKCGYHALEYNFLPTGEPQLITCPKAEIVLIDMAGQPMQVTQWPNNKAAKYLGHQESLSNKKPHFDMITKKCDSHAHVIHCCHLNCSEIGTFYQAI